MRKTQGGKVAGTTTLYLSFQNTLMQATLCIDTLGLYIGLQKNKNTAKHLNMLCYNAGMMLWAEVNFRWP